MQEEIISRLDKLYADYRASVSALNGTFITGVLYGVILARAIVSNPNLRDYCEALQREVE